MPHSISIDLSFKNVQYIEAMNYMVLLWQWDFVNVALFYVKLHVLQPVNAKAGEPPHNHEQRTTQTTPKSYLSLKSLLFKSLYNLQ